MATRKPWTIVEPKDYFCTNKEYCIDGRKYARVTRTLGVIGKPGLIAWFLKVGKKQADKVKETRQVVGSKVHHLIELNLKGKKYNIKDYEEEIQTDLELFDDFKVECKLKPEGIEQHLWSNTYGYAGTADFIGKYKSSEKYKVRGHALKFTKLSRVILDWKTSRIISDEYWLQMAAYIMAFKELTGIKLEGAALVQIRFGKIKVREKTYDELELLFEVYKAVLVLYYWKYKKEVMVMDDEQSKNIA